MLSFGSSCALVRFVTIFSANVAQHGDKCTPPGEPEQEGRALEGFHFLWS